MGKLNRPREAKYSSGNEALRSENKLLKRQLKQLRKQASRTPEIYADEEGDEVVTEKPDSRPGCVKCCSKDIKSVPIPTGMITVCKGCSYRWKS